MEPSAHPARWALARLAFPRIRTFLHPETPDVSLGELRFRYALASQAMSHATDQTVNAGRSFRISSSLGSSVVVIDLDALTEAQRAIDAVHEELKGLGSGFDLTLEIARGDAAAGAQFAGLHQLDQDKSTWRLAAMSRARSRGRDDIPGRSPRRALRSSDLRRNMAAALPRAYIARNGSIRARPSQTLDRATWTELGAIGFGLCRLDGDATVEHLSRSGSLDELSDGSRQIAGFFTESIPRWVTHFNEGRPTRESLHLVHSMTDDVILLGPHALLPGVSRVLSERCRRDTRQRLSWGIAGIRADDTQMQTARRAMKRLVQAKVTIAEGP